MRDSRARQSSSTAGASRRDLARHSRRRRRSGRCFLTYCRSLTEYVAVSPSPSLLSLPARLQSASCGWVCASGPRRPHARVDTSPSRRVRVQFPAHRCVVHRRSDPRMRHGKASSGERRRARAIAPAIAAIVDGAAGAPRRASAGARGGCPPRRSTRRRRCDRTAGRGRSADRCSRCSRRVTAHSAQRARIGASTGARGAGLLGRRRGSRLGRSAELYGARRGVPAAHRDARGSRRGGRAAGCGADSWMTASSRRSPSLPPCFRRRNSPPGWIAGSPRRLSAGRRHGGSVFDVDRVVLGPHGLVVFESADPAAKRLVAAVFVRELEFTPAGPPRWRRRRARNSRRVAISRKSPRNPAASPCFTSTANASQSVAMAIDHRSATTTVTLSALAQEAQNESGAFQSQRAAAADRAGHALPDHLLRVGPSELAYLGQLRGVYQHSACRCR